MSLSWLKGLTKLLLSYLIRLGLTSVYDISSWSDNGTLLYDECVLNFHIGINK